MFPAFRPTMAVIGLSIATVATPSLAAVNNAEPGAFVDTLADEGFSVLRTGNRKAARAQFRTLLSQHFAIDSIGDRLIRRWTPKITPQQRAAYKAAFPNFIIGTYADRLFDYARADLKVTRVIPAGAGASVKTVVTNPGSARPINADWTVTKAGNSYKVSNLIVGGVNLSLTQAADFDAVIQSKGFDALVAMMKSRS